MGDTAAGKVDACFAGAEFATRCAMEGASKNRVQCGGSDQAMWKRAAACADKLTKETGRLHFVDINSLSLEIVDFQMDGVFYNTYSVQEDGRCSHNAIYKDRFSDNEDAARACARHLTRLTGKTHEAKLHVTRWIGYNAYKIQLAGS